MPPVIPASPFHRARDLAARVRSIRPLAPNRRARPLTVGIPRALYSYTYPGLWETFFREIGAEPVLSRPTDVRTVERAVSVSEAEHCLPNKLFDAHVAELAGSVDRIFVPRTLSMRKGYIACPKLGALPDAVRAGVGREVPLLVADIDENRRPLRQSLCEVGRSLRAGPATVRRAWAAAEAAMRRQRAVLPARTPAGGVRPFLVLGHPYVLLDPFLSGGILHTLRRLVPRVEALPYLDETDPGSPILWCTSNKMLHRLSGLDRRACAAVVQISVFNCGCDSMMIELFRSVLSDKGVPYLVLIVDEHSARAGMDTRLEAFVDSVGT